MEATNRQDTMRPTYTQVLRDGRWQNVTAMRDDRGRMWWYLWTAPGDLVGFNEPTLDRMETEGTARTLSEEDYMEWVDEETIAWLRLDVAAGRVATGVGVN